MIYALVLTARTALAPASAAALRMVLVLRTATAAVFFMRGEGRATTGNWAPTDLQVLPGTVSVLTISTPASGAMRPWFGS